MEVRIVFLFVSLASLCWCSNFPGIKTTEKFDNALSLDTDGNYLLFWNFNESHVTFEVHVRTKGWVGFGLSGNGKMFPGDVALGWVLDDGTVHFSDRHTVGHITPVMDKSQDWKLLFGEENEFGTVLKFIRKINTCDDAEDTIIPEETVRLIYAYGQDDPADEDSIIYHGTTRGTKSVSLLNPNAGKNKLPSDVKYFDFLNHNYQIPSDKTTYNCRGFKLPPIGKHHMIKYEPIITPGNELHVHHILLSRCKISDPDRWDGKSSMCYQARTLPQCYTVTLAWAIGGEAYSFPDNVGFSIGGPEDETFFVMETHYDNPSQKANMIDNSGIRLTLTSTLRQHEAGMLVLGTASDESQVVPPGLKDYVFKTFCSEDCMNQGFKQSNVSEIKIIGTLQHAHLIAKAITTRHFRNGTELPPLMTDPNYDFNFQQTRSLPKEVSVYPGDSFQVDCTYDSTGRNTTTFGGFSTQEEMCNSFMFYYPKTKLGTCISRPLFDNFPFDTTNKHHAFGNLDWTNNLDYFLAHANNCTNQQYCVGPQLAMQWPFPTFTPFEPEEKYVPPPPVCS